MMPLYDFTCNKCGKQNERIVHWKERTLPCDACNGIMQRETGVPSNAIGDWDKFAQKKMGLSGKDCIIIRDSKNYPKGSWYDFDD